MRSFADILRQLQSGRTWNELQDSLHEVCQAVATHRKPGEITLKLKITPNGETTVLVHDEIKVKAPEPPRANTLFFMTSDGGLVRDDPNQPDLPLREVATETETTPREVENA